jgi:hypothetical protein
MLQCARCKSLETSISHFVYKSSKDRMTHLGVCKPCWDKARTLKVPKLNR